MGHVCFHCGELFDEGRLVCPHCGADREMTYYETPPEALEGGWSETDDAAYKAYLKQEGLAPLRAARRKNHMWWGLLALLLASGLILLLL